MKSSGVFTRKLTFVIFLLISFQKLSLAQWSTNPSKSLLVGSGLNPEICSDSSGGCYITIVKNLNYPRYLVLERLDRNGFKTWPSPVQIIGELPEQSFARIISDGEGGVFIAYSDIELFQIGGRYNVRVQRVDSCGTLIWGPLGVRVSISEMDEDRHDIINDGNGGCIISWVSAIGNVKVNRIDNNGLRAWSDSGVNVWSSNVKPSIASDGQGGCFITDNEGKTQRLDQNGLFAWTNPVEHTQMAVKQLESDSENNVYLFGSVTIGVDSGVYVRTKNILKLSFDGQLPWGNIGVVVDTEKTDIPSPNYALNVWRDGHVSLAWGNNSDDTTINYIQNISVDGSTQFEANKTIGSSNSHKIGIQVIPSDNNSVVYSWMDYRQGYWSLWSQKLDSSGLTQWDSTDVPITTNGFSNYKIIGDGQGGCIALWFVQSNFSIFAQQINRHGRLGEVISHVDSKRHSPPTDFTILQNYPNPFNPSTNITIEILAQSYINLSIFNAIGQKIDILFDGTLNPGKYFYTWEPNGFASGLYMCELRSKRNIQTKKMLFVR